MRSATSGFTFLEIVIVIAVIGFMMSVVIPNINKFRPGYERKAFVADLSALVQLAWQDALITRKAHRIYFDLTHHQVHAQQETGKKNPKGELTYQDISEKYIKSVISWPSTVAMKELFIDGANQLHRPMAGAQQIDEAWFYIYPDGSMQEVVMNLFDSSDTSQSEAGSRLGLVLSPFTGKFTAYDVFQQP